MNNNRVSVVIPTYNSGSYITLAIQSVLDQSYENFEILVIDDGSTDNTMDIVKGFVDSRIRYIRQGNSGVSSARNRGIKEAAGEYIALLDADDVWFQDKLEWQIRCMEEIPEAFLIFSDFSASDYKNIYVKSYRTKAFNFFNEYNYKLTDIFSNQDLLTIDGKTVLIYWGSIFQYLVFGNFILPSSVLIKKDAFLAAGMFDDKYRVAEETDFFLRVAKSKTIAYIDESLLTYRLPDTNHLSGKNNTEKLIRNNIKILESHLSDTASSSHKSIIRRAIGRCFYRLAYYHLSVLELKSARVSARKSVHSHIMQWRAYLVFIITLLPRIIIRWLGKLKAGL